MNFVDTCIQDSLPIWESCLQSEFLTKMADGTLNQACFRDYIVDDSLYLRQYARCSPGASSAQKIRKPYAPSIPFSPLSMRAKEVQDCNIWKNSTFPMLRFRNYHKDLKIRLTRISC